MLSRLLLQTYVLQVSKVRLRKRNQRPSFRPGSRRVKTQEEKEREWERKRHKMKLETESAAGEDDEVRIAFGGE